MENIVPKLRFPEFEGNWEKKKIGEVCEVSSGGTPSRSKPNYWNGNIPWVSTTLIDFNIINRTDEYITDDGLKNSSAKIFPKGTLLMAMYGQGKTRGKTAILGIDASTNQACGAIIPNLKLLNPTFLFQDLCNRYDIIRDSSNQGGQENLSGTIIKSFSVTYPSLPEQQKIASFLTSVDERLTLLAQQKEKLELYKKGVMQQIFSQKLRFKDENGKDYADWKEKKLGEICKLQGGFAFKSNEFKETGIPVIRISNISNHTNHIDLNSIVFYNKIEKDENFTIKKGDLIIAMSGATTGKSSIYNLEYYAYLNQRVGLFKSLTSKLEYNFLIQFVFSDLFKKQLDSLLVAGAQPNISSKDIESLSIPFPVTEEQQKIALFLSAIDVQIEGVSKKIKQTKVFKKGLLQQMFV